MPPTASVLLLALACGLHLTAADAGTLSMAKPFSLVLLQTITAVAVPHSYAVNGFSTAALASMSADDNHQMRGFATPMEAYSILPPYCLRQGENAVDVDYHLDLSFMLDSDQGPWTMSCRVATVPFDPAQAEYDTDYHDSELLKLTSPVLKKVPASAQTQHLHGTFLLKQPLPAWGWEHGVPISDTPQLRSSLYAAYVDVHTGLAALHANPPASALPATHATARDFAAGIRASMGEYITACELRGVRYRFLDDLLYASAHLALREWDEEMAAQAAAHAKPKDPEEHPGPPVVTYDGPVVDSAPLGPDGKPPARLALEDLPPMSALTMTIFAGGTLARLHDADGNPLIRFRSNYNDGPWGQRGTEKLSADVWFRRTKAGQWAVDGIAPMHLAGLQIMDNQISELIELSGF